jgi:hypothetical protein
LLPVTDNNIALVYQTDYWMSFIYKGALALYSVAMFTDAHTHTRKKMMNSARHPRGTHALPEEQHVEPTEPGPPSSDVPLTQLRGQGDGGRVLEAVF